MPLPLCSSSLGQLVGCGTQTCPSTSSSWNSASSQPSARGAPSETTKHATDGTNTDGALNAHASSFISTQGTTAEDSRQRGSRPSTEAPVGSPDSVPALYLNLPPPSPPLPKPRHDHRILVDDSPDSTRRSWNNQREPIRRNDRPHSVLLHSMFATGDLMAKMVRTVPRLQSTVGPASKQRVCSRCRANFRTIWSRAYGILFSTQRGSPSLRLFLPPLTNQVEIIPRLNSSTRGVTRASRGSISFLASRSNSNAKKMKC